MKHQQEEKALEAKIQALEEKFESLKIERSSEKETKNQLTGEVFKIKGVEYSVYRGPKNGLFYIKDGVKKYVTNYFNK